MGDKVGHRRIQFKEFTRISSFAESFCAGCCPLPCLSLMIGSSMSNLRRWTWLLVAYFGIIYLSRLYTYHVSQFANVFVKHTMIVIGGSIDTYRYWKVSIKYRSSIDKYRHFFLVSISSYRYLGFSVYLKNREFSYEKRKIFL